MTNKKIGRSSCHEFGGVITSIVAGVLDFGDDGAEARSLELLLHPPSFDHSRPLVTEQGLLRCRLRLRSSGRVQCWKWRR